MENLNEKTDYEIIQLCIDNNKDAFEEIVTRYKNLVFSIILRMVNNSEEANDLSQEVFIKIYKNLDKYSPDYKLSTWIMRITTNHIIDYRRKKKQDTISIEDVDYELTTHVTPEEEYIKAEENNALHELIKNLPDLYRNPIVMYHNEGLSYQEIAAATQQPLSKIKNRIFRGRKLLKEALMKLKEGDGNGLQKS